MTASTSRTSFPRRVAAARPRKRKYDLWDDAISGLGLSVHPSGTRSFFLRRRTPGGRVRRVTLGSADAMSVPQARREARRVLPGLADPPARNAGPRYPGRPMADFAAEFLERHARHWKPRTRQANRRIVQNEILPVLGHLAVDDIGPGHVRDWFAAMADRPGTANRSMPVLSVMMRMAELWGYRDHNTNPCRRTRRYRTVPRERFLTQDEMARLGAALDRHEPDCPQAVAVIRLLLLTGCRAGEVTGLQWDWIRDRRILLPDSKSGPRTVWLAGAARAILDAVPRRDPDCPFVFPGRSPGKPVSTISQHWRRIRDDAGLAGVRLHDLRHTWASVAAMNGADMVTIARLLGHALVETTERYVHLSARSVADAADRISGRIGAAMAGDGGNGIVEHGRERRGGRHAQG